jgi:multiple antibiotic resistance protein
MELRDYLETSLYLLATINPASKIFLLSTMDPPYSSKELLSVSLRSTFAAFMILAILAVLGNMLLVDLFKIELYSLKVAGGLVLLGVGWHAVSKGRFYEKSDFDLVSDLSIVPLAAPFIAGPGSITVAISIASTHGKFESILCVAAAVLANMLFMLSSPFLGKALDRVHAIGPSVRICGLVVMAMAVQMVLAGLGDWILKLRI